MVSKAEHVLRSYCPMKTTGHFAEAICAMTSIGIGSNAMLQNVYAQNVGSPDGIGSLDLKQAT